ncbi:MAG: hypothetical protein WCQ20_15190, partial [Synechococcaceae cyanobacterium ELA739]
MLLFALSSMPACLSEFAIDGNNPPWQVWIGAFASEHLEQVLEQGGTILLFPNDPEQQFPVLERWQNSQFPRLWMFPDVLGGDDGEVEWYSYNDSRQNGFCGLGDLQPRFPNLRLLHQLSISQRRFDGLMERWIHEDSRFGDLLALEGGRLWFRGLYPAPIFSGLGTLFSRFAEIIWTPSASLPMARDYAQQELNALLSSASFAPMQELTSFAGSAQTTFLWRQDRFRRLLAQVSEKAQQIAALSTDRDTLVREQQQNQLHCENLACERDGLTSERDGLRAERQALVDERTDLVQERDGLLAERQALQAERDGLASERDRLSGLTGELHSQLQQSSLLQETWALRCLQLEEQDASLSAERDALVRDRNGLLTERQPLLEERNALMQERDDLLVARQALQMERDGLVSERDEVIRERDGLQTQQQVLLEERNALTQERDDLLVARQALQMERDGLVSERDEV